MQFAVLHNPKASWYCSGELIIRNKMHIPQHNIQGTSQFDTILLSNFISYHKPRKVTSIGSEKRALRSHKPETKPWFQHFLALQLQASYLNTEKKNRCFKTVMKTHEDMTYNRIVRHKRVQRVGFHSNDAQNRKKTNPQ